jgi:thiamine pyrophosphokinase
MIDTVIVSGGSLSHEFALDFLNKVQKEKIARTGEPLFLVAADRGYEFFLTEGLTPDLAVGDFDSLSSSARENLDKSKDVEVICLKPEKDDSDTQSAMNYAIERGARKIAILGATGKRQDHMLANLGLFLLAREKGAQIVLVDPYNYMRLVPSGTILEREKQFGKYVSFFPLGGAVEGLRLTGFKYRLNGYHLRTEDSGLTVSNEIIEDRAQITYETGTLLMIMSRD